MRDPARLATIACMPTYEYRCETCKHQFEVFAGMNDPEPAACEGCGGVDTLTKVLFPVAVHYKGSGFYSTDYSGKKSSSAGESTAKAGESTSTSDATSSSSGSDSSSSTP